MVEPLGGTVFSGLQELRAVLFLSQDQVAFSMSNCIIWPSHDSCIKALILVEKEFVLVWWQ